jgi:hypothetical protein
MRDAVELIKGPMGEAQMSGSERLKVERVVLNALESSLADLSPPAFVKLWRGNQRSQRSRSPSQRIFVSLRG